MTKGRNTSVLTVRLPDELATSLRTEARRRKLLLNDYLKSILASHWELRDKDEITPLDLAKEPEPETKSKIKYPKTSPNAPCPCGALHPDGIPKKYKYCHGTSKVGLSGAPVSHFNNPRFRVRH